jgi:phospholipid/cholesterol/gamma-HCH transport system substrate-binding protein
MKKFNVEMAVGVFLVAGFLCFAYLSVKLGDVNLFGDATYQLEMAGVPIGTVKKIELDPKEYEAVVHFDLQSEVRLQEDSIASIRTAGIIGSKYIDITPGGMEEYVAPGGELFETESAINLEKLVSKYIFEK